MRGTMAFIFLFCSVCRTEATSRVSTDASSQPKLLLSAEFDYARLPRELWHRRILLARSAGFNALTIPMRWSFHEPQAGLFLFDGRRDVGHLLDLCRREEMWVIARLGPVLDGDWELGGLPPWLLARMVHPRTYDRQFLAATDRWFEKVVPLLAVRQVVGNHGQAGPVILVEVESNPRGDINRINPAYAGRLRERVRSLGIEVPIIEALNESSDNPFAPILSEGTGGGPNPRAILRLGKARPWGESDAMSDRSMEAVRLLARGVRWLDCRAFFGGTNFGFQAAEGLPARHDCGAPVSEAGDLRPAYFALKQWLWWARGVERLLVESRAEPTSVSAVGGRYLPAWRHRSPTGELCFIARKPGTPWSAAIALGDSSPTTERIEFEPRGLWPFIGNWALSDSVTIEASAAKLLHVGKIGGRRLFVAAMSPGETRTIWFRTAGRPRFDLGGEAFAPTSSGCALILSGATDDRPRDFQFIAGETVHVVAASEAMFARTWPLATPRGNALLVGGDALLDIETSSESATQLVVGSASLPAEYHIYADAPRVATSRGTATFAEKEGCWIVRTGAAASPPPAPRLERWQQRDDKGDAQRSCDVSGWAVGSEPLTIERLSAFTTGSTRQDARVAPLDSPHAWYRTTLDAPAFSTYTLRVGGIEDRATVFFNGWCLGSLDGAKTDEVSFILPSGQHVLSLLVEHDGRETLRGGNDWPIPDHCFKGLRPPAVIVEESERAPFPYWQFVINNHGPDDVRRIAFSGSAQENWQILWPGPDDMNHQIGFAWYRFGGDPQLPGVCYPVPHRGMLEISMPGVDDRAWVYLDGQFVGTHADPRRGRVIRVPETLPIRQATTSHSLAILIENLGGPGGIVGSVRAGVTQREAEIPHSPWRMRIGLTGERENWFLPSRLKEDSAEWADVTSPTRQTVVRWYRTRFHLPVPVKVNDDKERDKAVAPAADRAETFFLHLGSLQRGVVWLNGHCLGRYRNIGYDAERGICVPPCWLERENWIVVAETGRGAPEGAFLSRDPASHYYLTTIRIGL